MDLLESGDVEEVEEEAGADAEEEGEEDVVEFADSEVEALAVAPFVFASEVEALEALDEDEAGGKEDAEKLEIIED